MNVRNFKGLGIVVLLLLAIFSCQIEERQSIEFEQVSDTFGSIDTGSKAAVNPVYVYSGLNRTGVSKVFTNTLYAANLAQMRWPNGVVMDNTINSIVVPAGVMVTLTVDIGFNGTLQSFSGVGTGKLYNLTDYGLANKVTSMHIRKNAPAIKNAAKLANFPDTRENGWSEECQGVTTDGEYWYISTKYDIRRIHKSWDLNQSFPGQVIFERPFSTDDKCHIGDITYYQGEIFIPIEHCGSKYPNRVYVINRAGQILRWCHLPQQSHVSWVAINPDNGLMYTCNSDSRYLNVYNRNFATGSALRGYYCHRFSINMDGIQGGVFGPNGYLYITSKDDPEGISVFQLRGKHVQYQQSLPTGSIASGGKEVEGITWWDLDKEPNKYNELKGGQIHWMLLDNDRTSRDDITMKHIRLWF